MKSQQLGFRDAAAILREYGIDVLGEIVTEPDAAVAAAERFGYPVVLKAATPEIIHKTDVGVVILNLDSAEAVSRAFERIVANASKAGARDTRTVLVQKQARSGFEMLVGAKQDPVFGPVTMVGHGGRFVELWRDTAPGLGVLERADVERMLSKTKSDRVLHGFRGPALDRDAVIDLVIKVSRMMEARPEVNELDLNPVIVYEEGFAIVDARVIVGDEVVHPRATDLSYQRMKNLEAVFGPRSLAVVGASKPGSIGGIVLKNSRRIEKLYPVNPNRDSLLGLKCYEGIEKLPETPDLAVFALAPEPTVATFRSFCERGGRAAIIIGDGFGESGHQDLEDQLVRTAEEFDAVYIGPNCLGVIDNYSGLNTLFIPERRTVKQGKPSGLGVISQSGGIGLELLEMLAGDNLSVGKWVSIGNASGISVPEIMAHMGDDPRIKVIAIYLEGLRNGLQFMEVGKSVSRRKPVVLIKGGIGGGAAMTMSHTGSLAGSFEAFRAACEQAGMFLIEELTEDPKILINVLSILSTQPRAKGDRVAVVSVGGGAAILLADQITEEGMRLAEFRAETKDRLAQLLDKKIRAADPSQRQAITDQITRNPVDLFGDSDDDMLLQALLTLNDDPDVDILLVASYFQVPYLSEYIAERLVEIQDQFRKPLILSPRGFSRHVWDTRGYLREHDFPTYTVPMIKPLSIALEIWNRYGDIS
ncbi:MAG: CoA-binding protein [Candidatus Eisenbacteria bacterium]|nr:CoA-binding protein [Candidatus Latescibacterota bacterium]MBD3302150.1 CoA-binding protein [Candidatus Eisenbacteria bacterium]